jgi:curved DNA-binding protein CbpA
LIYALDHRLSGSIVFEEPSHAKHAIHFVDGAPSRTRASGQVALLGSLLCERGFVDPAELDAIVAEARANGRRLGEVLVDRGGLEAAALEEALREQIVRRLEFFATLPPETVYGYYEGTNFLERSGGPASGPSALHGVWRVIRLGVPPERLRDLLARLGDAPLRFHTEAPLGRFVFGPGERAVVDVLRAKPQPLAELLARGLAPPALVELMIYAFSALRQLDNGSGARPVGSERTSGTMAAAGRPASSSSASAGTSPVPPATAPIAAEAAAPVPAAPLAPEPPAGGAADPFRRELAERLGNAKQSYYEVLGVPDKAPNDVIVGAFFQLAKRFHPDRLGPGFDDVREQATRLFARMTEAHQVLTDPARRKEYDDLVKEGGGAAEEQEEVLRIVRAATSFQKAQVLLKRNNLGAAETEARQALADDPSQADHIALVAWIDASKPSANLEKVLETLNDCVRMEEMNLRVRWFRGVILKRVGQERRAIDDFRYIVDRDPRHVDAQRELRLHDMQRGASKSIPPRNPGGAMDSSRRRPSQPSAPEKGSFFGKLFKK